MLQNHFPVFLPSGAEYYADPDRLAAYREKYERSEEGLLQYVTAVIRNDEGAVLV